RAMPTRAANLAGRTSLGALGAAIAHADALVCNDSGPAHVAYAVGTPTVTLFGPGNIGRWGPLDSRRHAVLYKGVACSPCPHRECPIDHRCLEWIGADEVVAAVRRVLCDGDQSLRLLDHQVLDDGPDRGLKLEVAGHLGDATQPLLAIDPHDAAGTDPAMA